MKPPVIWSTVNLDSITEIPPPQSNSNVAGNRIYLYSHINRETSLQLMKDLHELSHSPVIATTEIPIQLHIQSEGGELFSAFAIADYIRGRGSETPVHSIIEGYCASAATIISMACHKRFITKN